MNLVEIGYFSRTHGLKGQLVLKQYRDLEPESLRAVFVDIRGSKAPYFVSAFNSSGQGLLISLEEVDTIEKAKLLLNKQVYADENILAPVEVDELVGYELIDRTQGSLGVIKAITENGAQSLVHLEYKGREVLLPLVDELIEEIDDQKKLVRYNAPDGLIDMYLESN